MQCSEAEKWDVSGLTWSEPRSGLWWIEAEVWYEVKCYELKPRGEMRVECGELKPRSEMEWNEMDWSEVK